MRFVWTAAWKDFCRLRRDPFAVAGWLAIPLVMAALMHMVFGHEVTPRGRLLIADEDRSFLSGKLIETFRTEAPSRFLVVETVERRAGQARIDRGDGSGFLIIPPGFQAAELGGAPVRLPLFTNPSQRILPRIIEQILHKIPDGDYRAQDKKVTPPPRARIDESMEALIHHFKIFTEGFKVPEGEAYAAVESPRGELGCYIVSDGSSKPYRMHIRGPSFVNLQTLPHMMRGGLIADAVAVISSVDPIMGEVDR